MIYIYLQTIFSYLQTISNITDNFIMSADNNLVFAAMFWSDIHLIGNNMSITLSLIHKGNNLKEPAAGASLLK